MIQEALDALAAQIKTGLSIEAYSYVPLNLPIKPAAVLMLEDATYHRTAQNGLTEVSVIAAIIIGRADEESAQKAAHAYASPTGSNSFRAAVEANRRLNNKVKDCVVESVSEVTYSDIANDSVLVLSFKVLIFL